MDVTKKKTRRPPKLQKFMHPKNPYKMPPSFKKLALEFPEFRKHCIYDATGKVHLDFKNPEAVIMLNKCLLKQDFSLDVVIPPDTLVPTLPLRFNYLLWIQDLMNLLHSKHSMSKVPIVGYDIGTGASCIYPLLGATHLRWGFIGSDIDGKSLETAKANVENNNLGSQICLHHINQSDNFFKIIDHGDVENFVQQFRNVHCSSLEEPFSNIFISETQEKPKVITSKYLVEFSMCNPPFFSSIEELDSNSKTKRSRPQPNNAQSGKITEKMTDGGERVFIEKMIKDSCQYRDKIRLFSTLIGKKDDMDHIKKILIQNEVVHYKFTEFCQGRTMRWGVAWSFDASSNIQHNISVKEIATMKMHVVPIPRNAVPSYNVLNCWKLIEKIFKELKIKPKVHKYGPHHVGASFKAYKATWTNQRRKRRAELLKKKEAERTSGKRRAEDDLEETSSKRSCTSPVNSADVSVESTSSVSVPEESSMEVEEIDEPKSLPILVKSHFHVTFKNDVVQLEFVQLTNDFGGKDLLNQLIQYIKNKVNSINEL